MQKKKVHTQHFQVNGIKIYSRPVYTVSALKHGSTTHQCEDIKKGKQLFLSLKTTWENRSVFHIFLLFTYGQHDDKGGTNVQIMDLTGMSTHC